MHIGHEEVGEMQTLTRGMMVIPDETEIFCCSMGEKDVALSDVLLGMPEMPS